MFSFPLGLNSRSFNLKIQYSSKQFYDLQSIKASVLEVMKSRKLQHLRPSYKHEALKNVKKTGFNLIILKQTLDALVPRYIGAFRFVFHFID